MSVHMSNAFPLFVFCLDSNIILRFAGGGYLHLRVVGSPIFADIFSSVSIYKYLYILVNVLYIKSWLIS